MVLVVAVAVVGFPSHRFLARWLDHMCDPTGNITGPVVDLAVFRNAVDNCAWEEVRTGLGRVKPTAGEIRMRILSGRKVRNGGVREEAR